MPLLSPEYVPFTTVDAPVAQNPAQAAELLEAFVCTTEVHVLAIEDAGRNLRTALAAIRTVMPKEMSIQYGKGARVGFGERRFFRWLLGSNPADVGLHIDPKREVEPMLGINYHLTDRGEAEGSFFRILPDRESRILASDANEKLRDGLVDATLLEPVRYRTVSRPRTLVVFDEGNLAHDFRTTKTPRTSNARFGRAILRGANQ